MKFAKTTFAIFIALLLLPFTLTAQSTTDFSLDDYIRVLQESKNMSTEQLLTTYPAGVFDEHVAPTSDAAYLDSIDYYYHLTNYEKELLYKNGFMVTQRLQSSTFAEAFLEIYYSDLPVFVSTDAILHAMHMSYDAILVTLEENILIPELKALMVHFASSMPQMHAKYSTSISPAMQHALHDLDIYITLTRQLLGETASPYYSENQQVVDGLLTDIAALHLKSVDIFSSTDRKYDFSQFTIRGHYTQTKQLGQYFQAMIWLGRTEIYLSAPKEAASEPQQKPEDIQRQTMLAALVNELSQSPTGIAHLQKMENIILHFVGESDNVTVWQFDELMSECGFADAAVFADTNNVNTLQETLKTKPYAGQKILSQVLMSPMGPEQIEPASAFLLLGQRFIIDSYVFANVVFDKIIFQNSKIKRMLPSSLDALFALGNDAALQLLQPELEDYHYSANLLSLRYLIDAYGEEFWRSSLYNGWLNAIRALNPPDDRTIFPAFMQTAAWWQQKMNTQLASWAQLRHDNLLYAKQSYTGGVTCSYPQTYIEPYPAFYEAIKIYAQDAQNFFDNLDYDDQWAKIQISSYFTNLILNMEKLASIAQKELEETALSDDEISFLKQVLYDQHVGCGPSFTGWYTKLYYTGEAGLLKKDMVVADVHTAPTDEFGTPVGWVKHVGTGPIDMAVITTENCAGELTAYIGPVMSYYEHTSTNFYRLTDEEWSTIYAEAPSMRPDWTNAYLANAQGDSRGDVRMLITQAREGDHTQNTLPQSLVLLQNYPNPFNPTTFISFSVPQQLANQHVQLTVLNIQGQIVAHLIDETMPAGYFTTRWDGRQQDGTAASTGVYFYNLKIADHNLSGRMSLVK
ncbi:MAG: DUF3160 domain-containing protein [Deferribacteres bacterium]|nr:DUF3160 domain-containing protein [candidate division KSB1 bacterium]MCB9503452.1 DUF3160 domain-containing protein [Deferribacteres bacterium]